MIHLIIYRKLYADLFTQVKNVWELGGASPFAMGVDPERHWTQIAEHLQFKDCIYDFDVKAWEEKICLKLLNLTAEVKCELIERAYISRRETPPDIRKIAFGLNVDFMDTNVVFEDVVYRKRSGLLSGHPGTFMENSEIHEMLVGLIFRRILRKKHPAWATVQFIHDNVKTIKAADDIQIALSPKMRVLVSQEDIIKGYNDLKFELTSADKISEIRAKRLEESQFLKHHYRLNTDGTYTADPNTSIIYQLFNWVRTDTKLTRDAQFTVNVENAFRFAFFKGREKYEEIRARYNQAALPHNRNWSYDYDVMAAIMQQRQLDIDHINKSIIYPNPQESEDYPDYDY
jgi:hypothetical protein